MVVRLIVVILRLGALYALWTGMLSAILMLLYSFGSESTWNAAVALLLFIPFAAVLWIYARPLAVIIYPHDSATKTTPDLDTDRLEILIVQMVGVVLIFMALLGAVTIAYTTISAAIEMVINYDDDGTVFDRWFLISVAEMLLMGAAGLVLVIRVEGVRVLLRVLRRTD